MRAKKEKTPSFFEGEQLIINLFEQARKFFGIRPFQGHLLSCQDADFEDRVPKVGNQNAGDPPATTFPDVKNRPVYEQANEMSPFCTFPHRLRLLSQIPV
jgi:hypothetical protein